MSIDNVIILLVSFSAILFGADLVVKSVDRFSHKLRISSFAISFFLLGLLTSIPELAVGLSAISEGKPEVFVGNLIGGVAIIFFLVIPLLAIFGNGVNINGELANGNLFYAMVAIFAPVFILLDRNITLLEGVFLIIVYTILFFFVERHKGVFDETHTSILHVHSYSFYDILKTLAGVIIVFISSNLIVDNILHMSEDLGLSTFFVSLFVLSLGTNLPEISLAVKSILLKKKDIAFGDYIGSAAANTLLFGVFTLVFGRTVFLDTGFVKTFILLLSGLTAFYLFSSSKHKITRKEGIVLLLFYVVFVIVERL